MSLHAELLKQARFLAHKERKKPTQASLRRSCTGQSQDVREHGHRTWAFHAVRAQQSGRKQFRAGYARILFPQQKITSLKSGLSTCWKGMASRTVLCTF